VLALVAQGRTDRGIAEELFVTRKTVEAHVRSIFRKLELPSDASENRRVHAVLAFLQASGVSEPLSHGPLSARPEGSAGDAFRP
jgi:DNA-binding NarL/FixJ family response regulator